MATPLKYMYNPAFFEDLCPILNRVIPQFDERRFIHRVFDRTWPDLELKARTKQIARALHASMPFDFAEAAPLIVLVANAIRSSAEKLQEYAFVFLPEYIAMYGQSDPGLSLACLREITKLTSAEFAIRPFLIRYPKQTMDQLRRWSDDRDENVRRLSSEGCRPRLPWAISLVTYKKNPLPILPILENLKTDSSVYVMRSVANNLNDIAKDHPELVLSTVENWNTTHPSTRWIVKHGCRKLLQQGVGRALALHGFKSSSQCTVEALWNTKALRIGEDLIFHFILQHQEQKDSRFRLDFAIEYVTSTGRYSRRIFSIGEIEAPPGRPIHIRRRKSFKDLATRKHFFGVHRLLIFVNGVEKANTSFDLQ